MSEQQSIDSSNDTIEPLRCPNKSSDNVIIEYNDDNDNESNFASLMRTISEYTEKNVMSGQAAEDAYNRAKLLEEGKIPPSLPPKFPFFAPENKDLRWTILKKYIIIIICFWIFILTVWSIYWGSLYNRQDRLINLSILIGLEQDANAPISKALQLATENSELSKAATWVFKSNISETEIQDLIHNENYWGAIFVTENNVSEQLINSFQSGLNISTQNFVHSLYETARDPNAMESIIEPTLFKFASYFQSALQSYSYPLILSNLTSNQFANLQNTNLLSSYPVIQYIDANPVYPITSGPLQIGLIYLIIITFFQVMWLTDLYGTVAKRVITRDYMIFQSFLSQLTFLSISLAFTCLNRAFQINMNNTWSGGFGVFWMFSYLTMAAVGGANQNISLILFAVFPPLMGFWLLFFVIINISATFAPISLCPEFFRFTYAMPIKNGYELMKIALFNTSKAALGRYIGILVAWIVLNNILLPFCILFFATTMKRKIMKQQQEQINREKSQADKQS